MEVRTMATAEQLARRPSAIFDKIPKLSEGHGIDIKVNGEIVNTKDIIKSQEAQKVAKAATEAANKLGVSQTKYYQNPASSFNPTALTVAGGLTGALGVLAAGHLIKKKRDQKKYLEQLNELTEDKDFSTFTSAIPAVAALTTTGAFVGGAAAMNNYLEKVNAASWESRRLKSNLDSNGLAYMEYDPSNKRGTKVMKMIDKNIKKAYPNEDILITDVPEEKYRLYMRQNKDGSPVELNHTVYVAGNQPLPKTTEEFVNLYRKQQQKNFSDDYSNYEKDLYPLMEQATPLHSKKSMDLFESKHKGLKDVPVWQGFRDSHPESNKFKTDKEWKSYTAQQGAIRRAEGNKTGRLVNNRKPKNFSEQVNFLIY